jgi:hypothetical protein
MPAFRQTSAIGAPSSAWRKMNAIWLSLNFDFRMKKFLRPARNRKLEFSSRKRSRISGAGQNVTSELSTG